MEKRPQNSACTVGGVYRGETVYTDKESKLVDISL